MVVLSRKAAQPISYACLSVQRGREPGSSRAEVNGKAEGFRWAIGRWRRQHFTPQPLDVLFSDIIQSHKIIKN